MAATTMEATTSQNPQTSSPGNVSEIQRLTSESDRLARTVDSWNMWYIGFGIAALLVAFLVFFAQWRIIRKGKELASVQSDLIAAKDRQAIIDTKDQDERIAAAQAKAASSDAVAGKANEQAGHAEEKAATANERAAKAEASLASAEQHSAEANAKAEGFRLDIAKSNEAAARAQAQVAGATAEAAKANLELERLRTPRSLSNPTGLTELLKPFKGTEYIFVGCFQDQDSTNLLIQLDKALSEAGWTRGKLPPQNSFGDVQLTISKDFLVPITLVSGIYVTAQSPESPDALKAEPIQLLREYIRAAMALKGGLATWINPLEGDLGPLPVEKGESKSIFIRIGKKP